MKNKLNVGLCIILMLCLFSFTLVSSADLNPFSDTKTFNPTITADMSDFIKADFNEKYGVITLNSKFMYIDTGKIAEYSLIRNTELCMINCEAEGKVTLYSDGVIFDDVKFKTLTGEDTSIISSEYLIFNSYQDNYVDVPDTYKEVCIDVVVNETTKNQTKGDIIKECSQVVDTYKSVNQPIEIWDKYIGGLLRAGDYRWKIKGVKLRDQDVDFIPIVNSKEFSEWAVWNSSFNVGLTGYFTLNESSGQVALNIANPSINGTTLASGSWVAGKIGNGILTSVSQPGQYVNISSNLSMQITSLSTTFWVNISTNVTAGTFIDIGRNPAGDTGYAIGVGGTTLDNTGNNLIGLKNYISFEATGKKIGVGFHHIGLVIDSSKTYFYIDGVNVYNATSSGILNPLERILIGRNTVGGGRPYAGIIDEVGFWNRTLSASEVNDLYNSGNGMTYIPDASPGLTIVNSIPLNNSNSTSKSITFGCNITGTGTTNLTAITLNVTGTATWTQTETGLNLPAYNKTFTNNTILNGTYTWNCIGVGDTANGTSPLWTFNQQAYTLPSVIFNNQTPPDITSSNVIAIPLNITYNISSIVGIPLNLSSINIFYKSNSTTRNCIIFINGSCAPEWGLNPYTSNISNTFLFRLKDNEIYPATYNLDDDVTDNEIHSRTTLANSNSWVSIQLLNVTNTTAFNFFEIMSNGSSIQRLYYCNSSYAFGSDAVPDITTSPRCSQISSIPANEPYDHTHSTNSSHQVVPFVINITTGTTLGGVKVTPTSYFMLRGNTPANSIGYSSVSNISRIDAIKLTTNSGGTYTNQSLTIDAHLHQFSGNSSLFYYACANDTNNNTACSSPIRQDLLDLGNLPPTTPQVYSPINQTYAGIVNINYTASASPNSYAISNYNITLWNADGTFNQTIRLINGVNLSYAWDSTALKSGAFYIRVRVNDSLNQQSSGQSEVFSLYNINPSLIINSPKNNTNYTTTQLEFNTSVSDPLLDTCKYSLNGASNITYTCNTNFTITGIEGTNTLYSFANNSVNNINSSTITFFIDTIFPQVQIVYPQNITYDINVTALNYTATDTNLFMCWYSLDNGATNISVNCGTNLTGLTSNEGSNIWKVYANDTSGNTNSSSVTFFKDTIFPLIDYGIGTEVDNTNKSTNFIYINTTWTETNFYNITFRINGATAIFLTPTYYYNLTGLSGGIYRYNVTICDIVNNCNTTATRTINLDLSNPNVTLIFPPNNTYINNNTLNFTINVSDDVGVKNATIYIYNQTGQVNKTTTNFVVGTIEWLLGIPITLIDGTYNWFADVFDWSGNKQTTINNTLNIKTINPQIKIVYPTNNTNYSNYINQLNYTISGADICKYSLDGGVTNNTITCGDNITIANSEGSFYFIVYATDTYGNFNYTSVNIIVNLTKVVLNSPANASTTFNISTDLSCSGYSNPPANITNISLWDNSTGVFKLNQTQSRTGGQTETIAWTQTGSTADGTPKGFQITAKKNFRLKSVTLETNEGATDCYIRNNSNNQLATASVVGGVGGTATFNYDVINGQVLRVVCGSGSATVTTYDLTPFVQQNGIDFDYTNSLYDTSIANNGYRTIRSITTTSNLYQMNVNFTKNITQSILWTCQVCDINNNCFFANENRTIFPDTTFPVITITYPTGSILGSSIGSNLTLIYSIVEANPDTCWLDYQGVNTTIACGSTSQNFTLNTSQTLKIWANDTFGQLSSANSSWTYPLFENSQSYNATTYETATESFILNITYDNSTYTSVTANLIYNGTSYEGTKVGTGGTVLFTRVLSIPSVNGIEVKSFYWAVTLTNSTTTNVNSTTKTQTVNPIIFTLCNSTYNVTYINYTFIDESTGLNMNATVDLLTQNYGIGIIKEFIFSNNSLNNPSYAFCFSPPYKTIFAETKYMQYSFPLFPQRHYYSNGTLSNVTTNTVLYLLGTSSGIYTTLQVVNQGASQIAGAEVAVQRKINGVFVTVEQGTTDTAGLVTFWLNPNYDHLFTLNKVGYLTTTVTLRPTQSIYTVIMNSISGNISYVNTVNGISYTRTPLSGILRPGLNTFTYNISSILGNMVNCRFELVHYNGSIIDSATTPCTSNGFLSIDYTIANGESIFVRYYVDMGNGSILLESDGNYRALQSKSSAGMVTSFLELLNDRNAWGINDSVKECHRKVYSGNLNCQSYLTSFDCALDINDYGTDGTESECVWEQTADNMKFEFTMIVMVFLLVAILGAGTNLGFNYDLYNPGSFAYIIPVIFFGISMVGAFGNPLSAPHGLLYIDGLTSFAFLNNYIVAIYSALISGIVILRTGRVGA